MDNEDARNRTPVIWIDLIKNREADKNKEFMICSYTPPWSFERKLTKHFGMELEDINDQCYVTRYSGMYDIPIDQYASPVVLHELVCFFAHWGDLAHALLLCFKGDHLLSRKALRGDRLGTFPLRKHAAEFAKNHKAYIVKHRRNEVSVLSVLYHRKPQYSVFLKR